MIFFLRFIYPPGTEISYYHMDSHLLRYATHTKDHDRNPEGGH